MSNAYACYNKDAAKQLQSSSGGIFCQLAEAILKENGVVFGAKFNDQWEVEHGYGETSEAIKPFFASKYVQSRTSDTYEQVKQFLQNERWVLFSGTPCQIYGLKSFLGKSYGKLVCVDFICHGIPSPRVWREYLAEIAKGRPIRNINFRSKEDGWEQYALKIEFTNGEKYSRKHSEDLYMKGFLQDLYLRPSCYQCPFRGMERASDLTLADFWGVRNVLPEMFHPAGTSLIFVHTPLGVELWQNVSGSLIVREADARASVCFNSAMMTSPACPEKRKDFFEDFDEWGVSAQIQRMTKVSMFRWIIRKIKSVLSRLKLGNLE